MSISSYDSIFAFGTTQLVVAAGATNAILIEPRAGQVNMRMDVLTGGSMFIIGVTMGQTLTAASLAFGSSHWLVPSSHTIAGPARFYLAAGGATGVIMALIGLNQGT